MSAVDRWSDTRRKKKSRFQKWLAQPFVRFEPSSSANRQLLAFLVIALMITVGFVGLNSAWTTSHPLCSSGYHLVGKGYPYVNETPYQICKAVGAPDPFTYLWSTDHQTDLSSWNVGPNGGVSIVGDNAGAACATNGVYPFNCIELSPTSANSIYAVTKLPIDLSPAQSKNLGLHFGYGMSSTDCTNYWSWKIYFTTNATLPTENPTYDPNFDRNVEMVIDNECGGFTALYFNPQPGVHAMNDFPTNCSNSNTICFGQWYNTIGLGHGCINRLDFAINFTGSPGTGGGASWHTQTTGGCSTGWGKLSSTFPQLNLQSKSYYIGVWHNNANSPHVDIDYQNGILNNAIVTGNCYIANGYSSQNLPCDTITSEVPTPPPVVTYVQPNTDSSSFLGWFGRALGGAWKVVSGAVTNVVSPLLNLGSSFMSAIISGLVQVIQYIISGITAMLNGIGGLWGDYTLGTDLINFFSKMFNLVGSLFATAIGYITNVFNWLTNLILLVSAFAASVLLSIIIANLIPVAVTLINIFFTMFNLILNIPAYINDIIVLWIIVGLWVPLTFAAIYGNANGADILANFLNRTVSALFDIINILIWVFDWIGDHAYKVARWIKGWL